VQQELPKLLQQVRHTRTQFMVQQALPKLLQQVRHTRARGERRERSGLTLTASARLGLYVSVTSGPGSAQAFTTPPLPARANESGFPTHLRPTSRESWPGAQVPNLEPLASAVGSRAALRGWGVAERASKGVLFCFVLFWSASS
jgi:hypothetical protein